MRFSVPYSNFVGIDEGNKDFIDEMTLDYTTAADAVSSYHGIRLVFTLPERIEPKELKEVTEALEGNVAFVIPLYSHKIVKEYAGIPVIPMELYNTFHQVVAAAEAGIKEMFVTGAIMMNLSTMKTFVDKYDLKLRVVADVAQIDSTIDANPINIGPQSFWIRPEAVELYEGIVETMEISKIEKLVFYGKKESPTNLDLLIDGLPPCFKNDSFRSIHDKARTYCNMACRLGSTCKMCDTKYIDID